MAKKSFEDFMAADFDTTVSVDVGASKGNPFKLALRMGDSKWHLAAASSGRVPYLGVSSVEALHCSGRRSPTPR